MIDLRNTRILVVTPEENEKLLKEAEKQGFHWYLENDCKPLQGQHFPDILKFYDNKEVVHSAYRSSGDDTFYEASELLNTKEMTAREFAEWIADVNDCCGRNCTECVLTAENTKCNRSLCVTRNWKGNIDELLEIAASGRITVSSPEEKTISTLENFIKNPDRAALNDEFVNALKMAVEKLKEVNDNGEINT